MHGPCGVLLAGLQGGFKWGGYSLRKVNSEEGKEFKNGNPGTGKKTCGLAKNLEEGFSQRPQVQIPALTSLEYEF